MVKQSTASARKILTRGKDDSLDEAKKEAKEVLEDDGKPKQEIKVVAVESSYYPKGRYYSFENVYRIWILLGNGYYT